MLSDRGSRYPGRLFPAACCFPEHFWIAEGNGEIVACVNGCVSDAPLLQDEMFEDAGLHNEQGAWQMLFGVETHPVVQGKGYASALMRQMIEDARAQGRRGVVLTCKQELLDFYRRFGFENEGISAASSTEARSGTT